MKALNTMLLGRIWFVEDRKK